MDLGNVTLDKPLPYVGITPIQIATAIVILVVGWIVAKIIVASFKHGLKKTSSRTSSWSSLEGSSARSFTLQ